MSPRQSSQPASSAHTKAPQQLPHLLVVDDDPTVCMTAEFLLKNRCVVHTARNGVEALQTLKQLPRIALVLSDIMMPEMDGLELLQRLRSAKRYAELPLILISAADTTEQKVKGLDLGADDFVTKPFNLQELLARVNNQLRIGGLREQIQATNAQLSSSNHNLQIQNERLEKDLEVARQMQQAMLPKQLPASSKLQMAARYRPMERLGGDFYDWVALDNDKIGILIADVTGHGVSASFFTSVTKISFQTAYRTSNNPAFVLSELNQALANFNQSAFVTCFYAVYDPHSGMLDYASGGHPPLLVCSPQGQMTELAAQATFLGMFPEWEFSADRYHLQRGDRLFFYTDALYETCNRKGEFFGEQRAHDLIRNCLNKPLANTLETLEKQLLKFSNQFLDDDLTMVALERLA